MNSTVETLDKKAEIEQLEKALGDHFVAQLADIIDKEGFVKRIFTKDLGIDSGQVSRFFTRKRNMALEKVLLMIDHMGYEIKLVKKGN